MDKRTVNKIIAYLKSELQAQGLTISGIALFGSQLNNNAGKDSDLDLIIISEEFKNKNIFKRGDLTMKAERKTLRKFMVPMDILNLTPAEFDTAIKNKMYQARMVA